MKKLLPILTLLLLVTAVFARPIADWSYEKLTTEADLIVIAMPLATHDSAEKTTLPGIRQGGQDNMGMGHPIPAIGIETTFEILSILKGNTHIKKFIFYHLREAEKQEVEVNGPGLVTFNPKEKKKFLLFLKLEPDGRYSSVTGQTDPEFGVKDLGTYP